MYQRAEAKLQHKWFNPLTSFVDCEKSEQDGEDMEEIRHCKTSPPKSLLAGSGTHSIYSIHHGEKGSNRDGSKSGQPVDEVVCIRTRQHVG